MSPETESRRVLRRITTAMAEVVIMEAQPGFTAHRNTCPDGQFWLPVRGEQVIDHSQRQRPFELAYYAPRQPAVRLTDTPSLAYGLRIHLSQLREDEREESWVTGRHLDWQTKRSVLNMILTGLTSPEEMDTRVAQWIGARLAGRENSTAGWIRMVEDLLQDDPAQSLLDLSRAVGVVPAYLSAEFSRLKGVTISGYKRQVMLQRALSIAADSNLNESAIEAGFYDASHFHRACVAELDMKPSSLRKLIYNPYKI